MNRNSTIWDYYVRTFYISILLVFFSQTDVSAQVSYVYANQVISHSHVNNESNAILNDNTFATLNSYGGIAVGIGSYSGRLELGFPTTLPAGTTSYIRIGFNTDALNSLLGGGLGGGLADLLGTVVLGDHYFTVKAKNGATSVLSGSSHSGFSNENVRLIVDENGYYYVAITPNAAYDRLEIEDFTDALLLGSANSMSVYYAFYTEGYDVCDKSFATSFDGTGGTIDILGLGGAGVATPKNAIDGNPNTFSQVSMGALTLAGNISQTVYFSSLSNATDQFHITVQIDDPSILNLGLADGIKVEALNGSTVVFTHDLGNEVNLDLLQLLSTSQKVTIPLSPGQPFDRVKVTISSLLQLNIVKTLKLYEITRSPAPPVIDVASQNITVCSGQTATVSALTANTNELVWYAGPVGGVPLAVTAYNGSYTTGALATTTTVYVAARKIGCTVDSERIPVVINVVPVPIASDITIDAAIQASCLGVAVLAPTTLIPNSAFHYYTDQLKAQEITTGFSGHPGITYVKDNITGALTISGLTMGNTPITYYVSIEVSGTCENAINTLQPVQVTAPTETTLDVQASITGCGFVNLRDAIVNFDTSGDTVYTFYDAADMPITGSQASNIQASGIYYIQASNTAQTCASDKEQVNVTVNPLPQLGVSPTSYSANIGETVTLLSTSNAPIVWYDQNGTALASNIAGPFTQAGTYTFTVVANNGLCSKSLSVTVIVLDPNACPVMMEKVFADTQSSDSIITGGVVNGAAAIDHNLQTNSTIITGLGLLGIGTTWQTLEWNTTIAAGTPLTIKLGSEYSGLALIGAVSVVGTKRNGVGNPIDIGTIQPISGDLLNLLPGENSFEYTFVPANGSGPQAYDGVRIIVGSVLSVAQNIKVYEAYYTKEADPIVCPSGDVEDIFYGAVDLGVGALTSLVAVQNPWNAVDNDEATFATLYKTVGVLAAAEMTVKFSTPSQGNDILKIKISKPGTQLTVGLLFGFTIQRYMGNTPVGDLMEVNGAFLNTELLNGGAEVLLVSNSQSPAFDRVRIRFGGPANVLDFLQVHMVKREALIDVVGSGGDNIIEVCFGDTVSIAPQPCTTYTWYDSEYGGTVVATGSTFIVPNTLSVGSHDFYIQPVRNGCEVLSRTKITIIVGATAPEVAIGSILINSGTDTVFCSANGAVTLTAQLNSLPVLTNPVFHWYSSDGINQIAIPGETSATLNLTGLVPGTYTYYVGVSSDEFCETLQNERAEITFTILPFSVANDITINDVQQCLNTDVVLQPATILANPVYNWYFTNDTTLPIVNGTFSGVTYSIAANGALTISGLTATNSPYTYYVSISSDTTCQNIAGTFQDVSVIINDTPTPTTLDTTQDFCLINTPTVANIQVTGTTIIWYDAATGGNVVAPTTALVNGMIYYATQTDAITGCESSIRLAVTVQVNDGATPTTLDTTQDFCLINNPTVANIQVTGTTIVWYDAATGGNIIAPTTALVNGMVYYASQIDPVNGCESSIRLAVTVQVNDGATPTTLDTTQDFCLINTPTVANIQVTGTTIIWYDAATGGNIVAPTTALVNGMVYYASQIDPVNGCESSIRLAVTVQVNDGATPTTLDTTQDFCLINTPTVANIQVTGTTIIWYDAATGGNVVAPTTALVNGMVYYASQIDPVNGCESSIRLAVTVQVNDGATPTTLDTTQDFCLINTPTVANIQVTGTTIVWYDAATGGNIIAPTTALVNGMVYYASQIDPVNGCESSIRLAVTVQVNDGATPTTLDTTQDFCLINTPTVANIQVTGTTIVWYDAATGGNIVAPTTALVNGMVYYASQTDPVSGCVSSVRLAVTVQVNDGATPTTSNTTQGFCLLTNPTVSNIQVTGTGIVWYDAATGGNIVAPTTALVNGMVYYASQIDPVNGCESSIRLAVTVQINDGTTPTTNDTTQDFCLINNPTVANIQVNGTGIVWYDAATGGNVIAPTTALVNGMTYYASQVSAVGGCVSSIRLAVTVQINNAAPPTTTDATQDFCSSSNATIADIQVTGTGVVWYTTATGGTVLAPTTLLVSGTTYYASQVDPVSGCESSIRLAVTIQFYAGIPAVITGGTPTVCINEPVTYTTNAGMTNYSWNVTSGGNIISGGTATDNSVTVSWDQIGNESISVAFVDTNGCSGSSTTSNVTVATCSNLTITKTADNMTPFVDENVVFTIKVSNVGSTQFHNVIVNEQIQSGFQYVSYVASHGTYNPVTGIWTIPVLNANEVATLTLTVKVLFEGIHDNTATIDMSDPIDPDDGNVAGVSLGPLCLVIFNEFTPNEDGSNDFFNIMCAEYYPNNKLEVYNRYGSLVYSTNGYKNNWKGIANVKGTFDGTELPSGTYYYIFDIGESKGVKTGWLQIVR
ncbi:Ig-like domain-containing protein [Flavobacterium humi]|uniref:T9SS type B sorting domain-containing protein n=1 Tax=Flavobacterium humi TaxID=2562683 RepID=A0A4Z0LA72_9FLAO|nr:gliding motility-associated C-terminal domain-containing protein [Flavobacterium humi]TGD58542.1 T9SS type B sorting domain-containing protein [Flavobacterium humi]